MDNQNSVAIEVQQNNYIKSVIEAVLFVNENPVTLDQLKRLFPTIKPSELKQVIDEVRQDHEKRDSGMQIVEIAEGYQMLSNPKYASYLRDFYKTKHKEKLSKPALETLAIVAYKQPVARTDIELIRGVNSDGVVTHLLDKELIKVVGRKDIPGKPFIYGTTKQFLEYFGLKSLSDLPKLEEFPDLLPPEDKIVDVLPVEGSTEGNLSQEKVSEEEQAAQEIVQRQEALTEAAKEVVSDESR